MGAVAAVGTDPAASGTVTDTATLGSVIDPATATTGTDPATSATGTDPVALARVTDTPANEDSNAPQATSGIVSNRAAAGHSASTGAGPDSYDREEIPTEDAAGTGSCGHSASTGAGPDSHDQPRHSNSVESRAPSGALTSTGAATAGDDRNTTTGAEVVPLRTPAERWGAGSKAGTPTLMTRTERPSFWTTSGPTGTSEVATTLLDDATRRARGAALASVQQELEEARTQSRDRDDFDEDRPHRSSGSRRSRDRSEDDRHHHSLGSRRSEYRGNFEEDRHPRSSESRRSYDENDNSGNQVQVNLTKAHSH